LISPDVATSDGTATSADYTAVSSTVTFAANDPAITQTVALTTDTVLEDLEYLTFDIAVTDSTTVMTASVSGNANSAKIFIMDTSSEYRPNIVFKYLKTFGGKQG